MEVGNDSKHDVDEVATSSESISSSQTELFQKFLILEMQSELLKYFSANTGRVEDETGKEAQTLCHLKDEALRAEEEVGKGFEELRKVLSVVERSLNAEEQNKLNEAKDYFKSKSEVARLETELQTFIAKHGADLDSSIALRNDQAEALARTKNYLEQLETRNMELKQKLRASKEQWELVDNY
ncbi:unnamed protein product [Enterobius vermicularis]|uniref:RH1 domain-containing protein n=1 Tax=Enterobius vermicularis TaxID=51028 RepID=A0A0N4VJZ8_ENTVE|nr:unnamed protein product [Enterobius vermicularis]